MTRIRKVIPPLAFFCSLGLSVGLLLVSCDNKTETKVLVFSKTRGWYHESIPEGVRTVMELGKENGFVVDTTKDASLFTEENLKRYRAVVFLNTTGNVLNADQQVAFERYIQAGGGFVGIHSAADTEYEWPWYNKLVGAYFKSHPNDPNVRNAVVDVVDTTHSSTQGLPARWERTDEWYNYKSFNAAVHVLARLDESTYEGGEHDDDHPIAWYHEYDGGRAFYTGGGHTDESFQEPLFRKHLLGGIRFAMGSGGQLDFGKAYAVKAPEENRFAKEILSNDLNEPMELAVAPDGRVFFVERSGNFYVYNPGTRTTELIRRFPVMLDSDEGGGNGLLGMTIDPGFKNNNFIYFFHTPVRETLAQHISRFKISSDNKLDLSSEKVLLEIPIELESSAHTGGSMAWDRNGNLFISTGDNTVPFESDGYAPIDQRSGRLTFDAQRSSGNTNDLRGKILRIHPEPDGTYTIPEGNLFPKGTPDTRPEIYVMGCRNPYRITVDYETSILYWGEIGPDAGKDAPQGPKGYDEFNQAKAPGNFGWPYFIGNNIQYHAYDFQSKQVGDLFDPIKPRNVSPNNTGLETLPQAKPAMIWYPYDRSEEFSAIGVGGRSAMAGPVYHFNKDLNSKVKFPEYYDKALFVFDWMRNWVFVVRLDEQQNFVRLEPFMERDGDFRRPIDMETGPDGAMYMLEYGSVYGIDNVDARLVRITYNDGNRKPQARIAANTRVGHAPLEVRLSGRRSSDHDDDPLTFQWVIDGKTVQNENITHTFPGNGVYPVVLTVTDPAGLQDSDTLEIKVGNTFPLVAIKTNQNSSFFFPESGLNYEVEVQDKEDLAINKADVKVTVNYIANADPLKTGHQPLVGYIPGKSLMESSDCKACHQMSARSVGPAFSDVAERYAADKNAVPKLADKIIHGGAGVWGEHAMNAHPQLTKEDAMEIVKYILSLNGQEKDGLLPAQGNLRFGEHKNTNAQARFVVTAKYTDSGGESGPLTSQDALVLRPARIEAEHADKTRHIWNAGDHLAGIGHEAYLMIKQVDLKEIKKLTFRYRANDTGTIEVRAKSLYGPVIGELKITPSEKKDYREASASLQPVEGKINVYFIFKRENHGEGGFASLDWIEFKK